MGVLLTKSKKCGKKAGVVWMATNRSGGKCRDGGHHFHFPYKLTTYMQTIDLRIRL
jgi:hypothetical protein